MRLTRLQRTAPPIDRWSARRGESGGGYDTPDGPRTLAVGLVDELARYPGTVFDSQIVRDRQPWMHRETYIPPPVTWISWTAAGPTRPELHMRNSTFRTLVGNSASRYPTVDTPSNGMHTMIPGPGVQRSVERYVTTQQMVGARVNRLAPARYDGQTYSMTTRLQGGRAK